MDILNLEINQINSRQMKNSQSNFELISESHDKKILVKFSEINFYLKHGNFTLE
jgi:hypothetical protein